MDNVDIKKRELCVFLTRIINRVDEDNTLDSSMLGEKIIDEMVKLINPERFEELITWQNGGSNPYGYVDKYGNFEFELYDWMVEEPDAGWVAVFNNPSPSLDNTQTPCCEDYDNCTQACTPRGIHIANSLKDKELKKISNY